MLKAVVRNFQSRELTKIVLVVPLEAALKVMILSNHAEELVQQVRGLVLGQAIDVLDVMTDSKDGLPASDGVGADNWVLSGELITNVEWGATGLGVKLELLVLGSLSEKGLSVSGSEAIEEFLVSGGESVIDLVT